MYSICSELDASLYSNTHCSCAEGVQGDQDVYSHMDPHKSTTHHSVKQHGRIGSHPYEQLDYHKHTMVTTEAMHTMGGMKGTFRGVTGKEITKAMATCEVTANNRYHKAYTSGPTSELTVHAV